MCISAFADTSIMRAGLDALKKILQSATPPLRGNWAPHRRRLKSAICMAN